MVHFLKARQRYNIALKGYGVIGRNWHGKEWYDFSQQQVLNCLLFFLLQDLLIYRVGKLKLGTPSRCLMLYFLTPHVLFLSTPVR